MIKRQTADEYIEFVIERARAINQGVYAMRVERIEVFGSYLTDKPVLGDLDLMVTLMPRYADVMQQEALCKDRRLAADQAGKSFNPWWLREYWPTEEVHRAIRGKNKGISIHTSDERPQLVDAQAEFESIFEA